MQAEAALPLPSLVLARLRGGGLESAQQIVAEGFQVAAPRARTTALARQILEIARRDGLAAGAHLPEVRLAERLGVSRSPVRAALALLRERGAVEPAPRQGYRLVHDSASAAFAAIALPEPEEEAIYRDLVRARFANLVPQQVAVADVMRRYGCDRCRRFA